MIAESQRSERESQPEEDTSVPARIARLEMQYAETGIRRSVDAVMIVLVRAPCPRSQGDIA